LPRASSDEKSATPVTAETVFDTGSLSKQFTAAAILRLQEQGLLQVTDTLTTFIENVPPDKADIEQFWAWVTPGYWAASVYFEAIVKITGNIPPFESGETVRGHVERHAQTVGNRAWRNTIHKGIRVFIREVRGRLARQESFDDESL
jgi:hypothetical protein